MQIIEVPAHFQPTIPFSYPAHQRGLLIEEFGYSYLREHQHEIETELVYLPIFWTGYHVRNGYGSNYGELQEFCDKLPKDKKYFTIVQYDDGMLVNMPNIITFSCCGNNPHALHDIPIPVLCDRHHLKRNENFKYFASFIGRIGGRVRPKMFEILQNVENFHITESADNTALFTKTLQETLFSLCPRGYGITSFRMYESLELGCIPIYIVEDDVNHWTPFADNVDWNKLSILIKESEIINLPSILKSMTKNEINNKLDYINKTYQEHFTLEGALKNIQRLISNIPNHYIEKL